MIILNEARGKTLTIKDLFSEMRVLRSRLIMLSHKYNRSVIGIKAITYKDILVKGGKRDDVMLNNEIRKEEIKDEFDVVKTSFLSYREEAIVQMRELIATRPIGECIVYFRDELNWSWGDICKLFTYSRSQANKIYKKYKNETL